MAGINHKKWAERILLFLVRRIKEFDGGDKFITYGNLARAVGYPEPYTGSNFGMNIGNTLGQMGHMFDGITIDGFKIPYIQALVVNQNEKLPSDGLKEFYPQYPDLSTAKKRDYVHSEFKRIFEFGNRWEKLITQLGVEYNSEVNRRHDNASSQDQLHNPYGSEGSPEHIALRNYVAENPSIIGVDNVRLGIVEYPLKSGDKVDAVFITDTKIVGVEVKSLRSGTDDIERGLYQCIKYSAVLEAEQVITKSGLAVTCILVLEDELPKRHSKIRKKLGVEVLEKVNPGSGGR